MIGEDFQCRFIYIILGLPIVLSVKVVDDFDFGVGVDVGSQLRGEDFGDEVVNLGHQWASAHVLEQEFRLSWGALTMFHGELVDSKDSADKEKS
jgi:hypothetical protein